MAVCWEAVPQGRQGRKVSRALEGGEAAGEVARGCAVGGGVARGSGGG